MEHVTIKDIAHLCGVGVTTVSRAMNDHPDINPETKEKIMETIRRYHYVPNNSARNLKRTASQTIAVMVKGISNPFFGTVIATLEREIAGRGYSIALRQVEEDEDELEAAVALEREKKLKGIIFLGGMFDHTESDLKKLRVPCVISTVDLRLPKDVKDCAVVAIDDEAESFRMVDYLFTQGHRRIAILTASRDDVSIGRRRLDGYRRALEAHGIPFDESIVMRMDPSAQTYTMQSGYEITSALLRQNTDFTCIYAVSDTLAIGACRAVIDAGLRIPEDICVAGFDGLDIARYYHPSITTICQPREEMASETVRRLFDMIGGKDASGKVLFKGQLFEGESTMKRSCHI